MLPMVPKRALGRAGSASGCLLLRRWPMRSPTRPPRWPRPAIPHHRWHPACEPV